MGIINLAKRDIASDPPVDVKALASYILAAQLPDGSIPWGKGRHVDPWNHVESAMALSIGGYCEQAERAYHWLYDRQLKNGGWWSRYENGCADDKYMETNFIAYIATGVWHHYCVTKNDVFLSSMWPMVDAALDCVIACQHKNGHIGWEIDTHGQIAPTSLLAGCSSIHRSLDCGLLIAKVLGHEKYQWVEARDLLGDCLRKLNHGFMDKSRYAMDWFYPLLSGALTIEQARMRINEFWDDFVVNDLGCRCVSDEPWIAVAESCELAIALQATGESAKAKKLYAWLHRFCDKDSGYWTGYQYELGIPWPREKTTWTVAAVLLACDALYVLTPAADIFLSSHAPQ